MTLSLIIVKEVGRQKSLIRPCFVFSAGWSTRNLKDGMIFSLSPVGLSLTLNEHFELRL